jgi:hypothetical protein
MGCKRIKQEAERAKPWVPSSPAATICDLRRQFHYCSMLMKQAKMVLRKTAHTFMIGNTKNSQAEKFKEAIQ